MEKIKQWIVSNKVWSIVIASALVVAIALAIALPLALAHRHTYSEDWSHDTAYHWHDCTGEKCNETSDKAEHTYGNWVATTPAGYGVDIVQERTCTVCGYNQSKTIEGSRLESHNTLIIGGTEFFVVNEKLTTEAYVLSGTVSVGDKLTVDGYDGELTVAKIAKDGTSTELNEIGYTYEGKVNIMFEESVATSEVQHGSYITRSGAPVQRYTKLTLSITTTSERTTPIFNSYRSTLTIGGQTVTVVASDIVNTAEGSDIEGILGNGGTGTMTVTLTNADASIVALIGMEVVGKENTKTVFNGTVTGVLNA